jgi:hypothetical protein
VVWGEEGLSRERERARVGDKKKKTRDPFLGRERERERERERGERERERERARVGEEKCQGKRGQNTQQKLHGHVMGRGEGEEKGMTGVGELCWAPALLCFWVRLNNATKVRPTC